MKLENLVLSFMRVSGLILISLATHFAITHMLNDVVDTDAEFAAERPKPAVAPVQLGRAGAGPAPRRQRRALEPRDCVTRLGRRTLKALLYSVTGGLFVYRTLVIVSYG